MSVIEQIEGLLRCSGGGDASDDYEEVHQIVDHATRSTQRVNFRAAKLSCIAEACRKRWPTSSPKVQALIDAAGRDREVLVASEERWAAQTAKGQPGQVRRYRKEQAARVRETMQAQMRASVAQAQAQAKSRKRGG